MGLVQNSERYLRAFSNRNIEILSEMFAEDVELHDWNASIIGKKGVLEFNRALFVEFEEIEVEIKNIIHLRSDNLAAVEFDLCLRNSVEEIMIPVVDIIGFGEGNKILFVRAYRGN